MSLKELLASGDGKASLCREDLEVEVLLLKEKIEDLEREAAEVERERSEALRLLGCSDISDLVEAVRNLREALDVKDADKQALDSVAVELVSTAEKYKRLNEEFSADSEYRSTLEGALGIAVEDREKLLRRLGLTDSEWACQGGACEAHMEIR